MKAQTRSSVDSLRVRGRHPLGAAKDNIARSKADISNGEQQSSDVAFAEPAARTVRYDHDNLAEPGTEPPRKAIKKKLGSDGVSVRKNKYATKAAIERLVPVLIETARKSELPVGGVEVGPDGSIRIVEKRTTEPATAFERWQADQQK